MIMWWYYVIIRKLLATAYHGGFVYARPSAGLFLCIISFNPYNNPVRCLLLCCGFLKRGDWGSGEGEATYPKPRSWVEMGAQLERSPQALHSAPPLSVGGHGVPNLSSILEYFRLRPALHPSCQFLRCQASCDSIPSSHHLIHSLLLVQPSFPYLPQHSQKPRGAAYADECRLWDMSPQLHLFLAWGQIAKLPFS